MRAPSRHTVYRERRNLTRMDIMWLLHIGRCVRRNCSNRRLNPGETKPRSNEKRMTDSEMNKPRSWNGKALTGDWLVSLKVDGVGAIWHDEHGWLRRADKPLCNIPPRQPSRAPCCGLLVGNIR